MPVTARRKHRLHTLFNQRRVCRFTIYRPSRYHVMGKIRVGLMFLVALGGSPPTGSGTERTLKIDIATRAVTILVCSALFFCGAVSSYAQATGMIRGSVSDPSGAVVAGATVEIQNPVSHYTQQTKTDDQGNFQFAKPTTTITLLPGAGISSNARCRCAVSVPVQMMRFSLQVGATASSVTVEAAPDLIETGTTTHTDIDRACSISCLSKALRPR